MRLRHGVPVEPAPLEGEALVTAPGPLLADVKAELEAERARGIAWDKQGRFQLLDEVRDAF